MEGWALPWVNPPRVPRSLRRSLPDAGSSSTCCTLRKPTPARDCELPGEVDVTYVRGSWKVSDESRRRGVGSQSAPHWVEIRNHEGGV